MEPQEAHFEKLGILLGIESERIDGFWNSQVEDRNLIPLTYHRILTMDEASNVMLARLFTWLGLEELPNEPGCSSVQTVCDHLIDTALEAYRPDIEE